MLGIDMSWVIHMDGLSDAPLAGSYIGVNEQLNSGVGFEVCIFITVPHS